MSGTRLLVIACGRSGTRYTSKVLQRAGLHIGHEKRGRDGMVSWKSVAVKDELLAHDVIWHQVREPLGVISSFHTVAGSSWRLICDAEPRISMDDALLLRCMKYWLYWNQQCEEAASVTYRVENMAAILPNLLGRVGAKNDAATVAKAMQVPENDHTRKRGHKTSGSYPQITWADIEETDMPLARHIREQAGEYGYGI